MVRRPTQLHKAQDSEHRELCGGPYPAVTVVVCVVTDLGRIYRGRTRRLAAV